MAGKWVSVTRHAQEKSEDEGPGALCGLFARQYCPTLGRDSFRSVEGTRSSWK